MNAVLGSLLLSDELEVDDRTSDLDADETTVALSLAWLGFLNWSHSCSVRVGQVMRVLTLLKKLLERQEPCRIDSRWLSDILSFLSTKVET